MAIAALATVAAVIVALYRDEWQARRRRPLLDLAVELFGRGTAPTGARLRIQNEATRLTAEDVQVLVLRVSNAPRYMAALPRHVAWDTRVNRPLPWSYLTPGTSTATLPPGLPRYVDLLTLDTPEGNRGPAQGVTLPVLGGQHARVELYNTEESIASLSEIVPELADQMEDPGFIDVALVARNTPARYFTLALYYDGQWPFDQFQADWFGQHFNIEVREQAEPAESIGGQQLYPTHPALHPAEQQAGRFPW